LFDVDWDAGDSQLALPVLGGSPADVIAAGDLFLDDLDGEPVVRYHEHVFPVAPGTVEPGGDLAATLARQHYRLAYWRDKDSVLNYRRFFDVDGLIAVRVEEPDVFDSTHRVLLDLHARGLVDGFRIDHPDGLADPQGYLQRLHDATGGAWVLVEKILEPGEALPRSWPCAGSTGYDAMLAVQTALVDPAAAPALDRAWADAGGDADLERVAETAKREAVDGMFAPEVDRLCRTALAATDRTDAAGLRAALAEVLVAVDVYRAYVRPGQPVDAESAQRLEHARRRAHESRPDLADEVDLLVDLAEDSEPGSPAAADFVVRLQQTCGPVMAKGIEDTTLYRWHRMVALNEVGGDPSVVAKADPEAMHTWAAEQQRDWPLGMTTLSTHDTKRSEDVRARLLALAGDPGLWQETAAPFLDAADAAGVDRPTAFLLWQTLVGAWPLARERLHDYLRKAMREAKVHTGWVDGDPDYEARVLDLADRALEPGSMRTAVETAVDASRDGTRATVLAAKLLQLCLPGVPDVYQGAELVTDSLVDPDNRRPVDFDRRRRMLADLDARSALGGLDQEKLLVTSRALRLRRRLPRTFGAGGTYTPLPTSTEHATGFVRGDQDAGSDTVACVVTRAPARLAAAGGWADDDRVTLPPGSWTDVLTGAEHRGGETPCGELFGTLPVALLERT
jgi:(1->4)-alpha-D-glucan 1-alpha-D-glucosylmutase